MNHTQRDNFHATLESPRVGVWTDAVFRLDRFADNAREGKPVQEGDLWGYVAIRADDRSLEIAEVVAYRLP